VRDPPRQVELFEAKAKELGKNVEVVWFGRGMPNRGLTSSLRLHTTRQRSAGHRVLKSSK
jgi:hypothetical protein